MPLVPPQVVRAVTTNLPSVLSEDVEIETRVPFAVGLTVYLLGMPPVTVNDADCPVEQLNVADVGVTASGPGGTGAFFAASHVPEPSDPVLVYVPDIAFQSPLTVPVRVVTDPSVLMRVRETLLFPLTIPVIVVPSDDVPAISLSV